MEQMAEPHGCTLAPCHLSWRLVARHLETAALISLLFEQKITSPHIFVFPELWSWDNTFINHFKMSLVLAWFYLKINKQLDHCLWLAKVSKFAVTASRKREKCPWSTIFLSLTLIPFFVLCSLSYSQEKTTTTIFSPCGLQCWIIMCFYIS